MSARRVLLIMLVVVVVAAGAYWLWFRGRPSPEDTTVVQRGAISATVDALGRVQPVRRLSLSTQLSGEVETITVEEGDRVEEGELLLQLVALEAEQSLEQARHAVEIRAEQLERALSAPSAAQVRLATARLQRATAARAVAQEDYDEIADEPDAESSDEALDLAVAKLEYEIADAELDQLLEGTSEVELDRLRLDLLQAEHALAQAERRLEAGHIRAPFAGTILQVVPREGENVHGYTPLIDLADLNALHVVAQIDELDIASVEPGQPVDMRLDAFPGEVLTGEVERILPGLADTRGATTYEAYISLPENDLALRPGMGANLSIKTRTVKEALLVPRRAVQQVGRYEVVTILEGRRERQVPVTTGLGNDAEIEILSGLEEGQTVLLH